MGLLNFPIFNNRTIVTLDQFLSNPTGKGTSMMAKRENIKKDLESRYYKLLKNSTKNGNFTYKVYIDKDSYFFWFKIPSETYKEIYYDVVLEFLPEDKKQEKFTTINDYSMNFFSNSPHMMFTYTYVLNEEHLLVEMLKSTKYSKEALKHRPKVTNPYEMFGFEKSCYYAAMYIKEKKLYNKTDIARNATEITKTTRLELLNSIMSQESKFLQYETVKKKYADAKRKEREAKAKKANAEHNKAMATYKSKRPVSSSNKTNTKKTSGFKSVFSKKK